MDVFCKYAAFLKETPMLCSSKKESADFKKNEILSFPYTLGYLFKMPYGQAQNGLILHVLKTDEEKRRELYVTVIRRGHWYDLSGQKW